MEEQQKTVENSVLGIPFTKDDPRINREGRKPDTPEQKLAKKAFKEYIKDFKESIAPILELIPNKLQEKVEKGDLNAIKEVIDILVDKASGKAKPEIEVTLKTIIINKSNGNGDNKSSSETK